MPTLNSRPLFRINLLLGAPVLLGQTPSGDRRMIPITGGDFVGDRLSGEILPDGAGDILLGRSDGALQQDVRMVLRAADGALILMTYRGVRIASPEVSARIAAGERVEAEEYYQRIAVFLETADQRHAWLNSIVAVGVGERDKGRVSYELFEIL